MLCNGLQENALPLRLSNFVCGRLMYINVHINLAGQYVQSQGHYQVRKGFLCIMDLVLSHHAELILQCVISAVYHNFGEGGLDMSCFLLKTAHLFGM